MVQRMGSKINMLLRTRRGKDVSEAGNASGTGLINVDIKITQQGWNAAHLKENHKALQSLITTEKES